MAARSPRPAACPRASVGSARGRMRSLHRATPCRAGGAPRGRALMAREVCQRRRVTGALARGALKLPDIASEALYCTPLRQHAIGAQRQHGQQLASRTAQALHRPAMPIGRAHIGARLHQGCMHGIDRFANHRADRSIEPALFLLERFSGRRGRRGRNRQLAGKPRQQVRQLLDPRHGLGMRLDPRLAAAGFKPAMATCFIIPALFFIFFAVNF